MPYPPGLNTWDLPGCSRYDELWDFFAEEIWDKLTDYFEDPSRYEDIINDYINDSDLDEDPNVVAERIYLKIVENEI